MAQQLPEVARGWLDGPQFATLATVDPDGRPQLSVVWVKRDGDDVLVSTTTDRKKHRNLVRDPRATLLVQNPDDAYSYLEVRGVATMTEKGGRELIDELSQKYMGVTPYQYDAPGAQRVVVRLRAEHVVFHG